MKKYDTPRLDIARFADSVSAAATASAEGQSITTLGELGQYSSIYNIDYNAVKLIF